LLAFAVVEDSTTTTAAAPTDIGIGTMNTSNIPPPATTKTKTTKTTKTIATKTIAETPIVQKSTFNNDDGQKTPPSTGSSARRQKLQLMREQAGAAATATTASSSAPLTATFAASTTPTAAFAAATATTTTTISSSSGGPPATAAFAAAISGSGSGSAPPVTAVFAAAAIATTTKGKGNTTTSSSTGAALPPPGKIASDNTTTIPSLRSESQSRLEEAYSKSEHDKTAALIKIKILEDQLNQKTKDDLNRAKQDNKPGNNIGATTSSNIVEQLLQMAEMNGPEAALDWAKSQKGNLLPTPGSPTTRPASRVGFNTGMGVGTPMKSSGGGGGGGGNMGGGTPTRRRIASRNLTPHPTKKQQRGGGGGNNGEDPSSNELIPENENPEETERRLIRQFREAAQYVPYEFSSELALYTVRRPYGIDGIIDGNIDDNSKNSAGTFPSLLRKLKIMILYSIYDAYFLFRFRSGMTLYRSHYTDSTRLDSTRLLSVSLLFHFYFQNYLIM
jgi:hypothetical protein